VATVSKLWDEIDAASQDDDQSRSAALLDALADRLRALGDHPDHLYKLGYVLYMHPARRINLTMQRETDRVLDRAVQLEPTHSLARMYRGYNAYDTAKYGVAKHHFESADPTNLGPTFVLNRLEIILSCEARCHGLLASLNAFEHYVNGAEHAEYPTDIYPFTLLRTLEDLKPSLSHLTAREHDHIKRLCQRVNDAAQHQWLTDLP
jgi:hypothetical protein